MKTTLFLFTAAIWYAVSKFSLDLQICPVYLEEANNHQVKDTRLEELETVRGRRRQQAGVPVEVFCRKPGCRARQHKP